MKLTIIGCILLLSSAIDLIFTWTYIDKENYVNGAISLQEINPTINRESYSNPYIITGNNSASFSTLNNDFKYFNN
jgi:hypothetical protein